MPETKTFTKKTELVFTTIEIEKLKVFLNRKFIAVFKYGNSKSNLQEKVITGISIVHCISQASKFLDCEIDERHYIIK